MENITFNQIQSAHDKATDSLEYSRLVAEQRAQSVAERTRSAAGCLLREGLEGFTSGTPQECPVKDCIARFDKNSLRATNTEDCADLDLQRKRY